MNKDHRDPQELDLTKPRLASYKQMWKVHQDTVYWVDIKLAQQKGFKFYQTRSNAIILYDTLPAYCIPKVIMMESGEVMCVKVYASPRPRPKISFKDNWMKELGSKVAGGGEDSQQTQPWSKTQLWSAGRPVSEQPSGSFTQEIRKDVLFGCESTDWRTGGPVNASSFSQSCVPVSVEHVDKDKRRRRKRRRRSNKNWETCKWRTNRFVHTAQGNRHLLQSVWIATCSCETSRELPRSGAREEDRESSSSRSTSSRLAAK